MRPTAPSERPAPLNGRYDEANGSVPWCVTHGCVTVNRVVGEQDASPPAAGSPTAVRAERGSRALMGPTAVPTSSVHVPDDPSGAPPRSGVLVGSPPGHRRDSGGGTPH